MIVERGEPESVCDICSLPLEGPHIKWTLPKLVLKMHATCAHNTSGRIRNNVFRLYRLSEEAKLTGAAEVPTY